MAQIVFTELLKQKVMEKAASAAGDMKDAVAGGLENALNEIKGLITSPAIPALSVIHGKMVSETMEGRIALMNALMELIKTEGFQKTMKDFVWCLNQILDLLTYLSRKALEFTAIINAWAAKHP